MTLLMKRKFAVSTVLALAVVARAGAFYDPCFSAEEVTEIMGVDFIVPIRHENAIIEPISGNWDSVIVLSQVPAILLEDFLGYHVHEVVELGGSIDNWPALANNSQGVKYRYATEVWDTYPEAKKEYVFVNQTCQIMGSLDLKGKEGIWFFMDAKYDDDFGKITKLEIQAYMDKESDIMKNLGKIPSQQELFKTDDQFRKQAANESGMSEEKVGIPMEIEGVGFVYDPFECLGQKLDCFEWLLPSTTWSKNLYQQLVRNLELPVYMTFWGNDGDMGRYWSIIYGRAERNIPTFFYYWEPTIEMSTLTVPRNYIMFKSSSPTCDEDMRTDNLNGYGSSDCLDAVAQLLKVVNVIDPDDLQNLELDSTTFTDAKALIIAFNPNSEIADGMLREVIATQPNKDFRLAACTWLKKNPDTWKNAWIPSLTWEPPLVSQGLDTTEILMIIFGTFTSVALIVYGLSVSGVLESLRHAFMGDMMLGFIFMFWKMLDLSSTFIAFFVEINPIDAIEDWFRICYIVFAVCNFICFCLSVYFLYKYISFLWNHNDGINTAEVHRQLFKIQMNLDIVGMISFVFEDTFGSILQVMALKLYPETVTWTYLACVSFQLIEMGMSITSFASYQSAIEALALADDSVYETKTGESQPTESFMDRMTKSRFKQKEEDAEEKQ